MMISFIDISIVVVYLAGLFCWAIYVGIGETADDFLVFSRRAPFLLVLFSIISTWVGVGTTVVTAASAYEKGISLGLTACLGGILGAFGASYYAPRLKAFGDQYSAYTLGDFFLVRYSKIGALAAGCLILVVYLLLTAAQLVGLASLVTAWAGFDFKIVVAFAAISTVVYTAFAGIKSDFYTDFIHFIVKFITLFLVLLPITFSSAGGVNGLAHLPNTYFDPLAYGGPSFLIAGMIFGATSVFVTMELWQRVYASTSGKSASRALGLAILIIVAFYGVSALLGLCAKILIPNLADRDQALFVLMKNYLPTGVLGLGIAGFLAVFLSSLNTTVMVAAATITKDFWFNFTNADKRSPKNVLLIGRVTTLAAGMAGWLIAMALPDLVALSVNGMFMLLILLPAIVGGFCWRRATAFASVISVIFGVVVTAIFIFIDAGIAFVPGFVASAVSFVIASFFTKHASGENLAVVSSWNGNFRDIK